MDNDIVAYLILYKFPPKLEHLKTTITHSLGESKIDGNLILRHLNQIKNKIAAGTYASAMLNKGTKQDVIKCQATWHNPQSSHPKHSCWWFYPHLRPNSNNNPK